MKNSEQEYFNLIAKHLKGATSPLEESLLEEWKSESNENKIIFEETVALWKSLNSIPVKEPDIESAWKKVKAETILSTKDESKVIKLFSVNILWRVAAIFILVIGLGYLLRTYISSKNNIIEVASENQKIEFYLPDSSKIYLNRNTRISFDEEYGKNKRTVFLKGEAFFEVKKNKEKPFVVIGQYSTTEVLGTSFNVKTHTSDSTEEIEVLTGKVRFSSKETNEAVTLLPGDKGTASKGGMLITEKLVSTNFLAWKTEKLVFDNVPLQEVINSLEDYYNVTIVVKEKDILRCRFTGSFIKPSINEMIQILSISLNLSYKQDGNLYLISGKGCK